MLTIKKIKKICKDKKKKKYSKLKKKQLVNKCLNKKEIQKICKDKNITGYSNLLKNDLVDKCLDTKKQEKKKYTVKNLKQICKNKGIKGYSKLRKKELVEKCLKQKEYKYIEEKYRPLIKSVKKEKKERKKREKKDKKKDKKEDEKEFFNLEGKEGERDLLGKRKEKWFTPLKNLIPDDMDFSTPTPVITRKNLWKVKIKERKKNDDLRELVEKKFPNKQSADAFINKNKKKI